jgi:lipopolysaccharide biosynthesis protein
MHKGMPALKNTEIRFIAFYLTQFHPVPENDKWWGKGFTEWTNVTKCTPLFNEHYQPHLPTDLGFYDLRVKETRHEQIELAKKYGIDGFCYHYYWFSGKRLLEKPLFDMLEDKESDFPFCLCWANENWSRRWDGSEHELLMEQKYRPEDDLNFIKDIMPFLMDPRYIKLDHAPFLIVYAPQNIPNPHQTIKVWREYCKSVGIDKIHLCAALTHDNLDYHQFGFDSGVEFPPNNLTGISTLEILKKIINLKEKFEGNIVAYDEVVKFYLKRNYAHNNIFYGVFPSWDNSARTRGGRTNTIVVNANPNNYAYWLSKAKEKTIKNFPGQERLIFINAWNEWAEGCHLEPDRKYQHQFLQATLNVKEDCSAITDLSIFVESIPFQILIQMKLQKIYNKLFRNGFIKKIRFVLTHIIHMHERITSRLWPNR